MQTAPTAQMTLRCPRDESPLIVAPSHGGRAHSCAECKGLFIDVDKVDGLRAQANCHRKVRRPAGPAPLHCPHDKDPLVPFRFKGVEVDVCFSCFGVWLDAGELEKVRAALSPASIATVKSESNWSIGDLAEFAFDAVSAAIDGL